MENSFSPWFGYGGENMAADRQNGMSARENLESPRTPVSADPQGNPGSEGRVTPVNGGRNSGGDQKADEGAGASNDGASNGGRDERDRKTKAEEERVKENGQMTLGGTGKGRIHLLSVIGEIEGHENMSGSIKTTKYEHILPELAKVEDDESIGGVLVLINTVGGDVSCGLALAEMLASLSKPTVSLVIGDSHSIGVPLAVATDYSFIVPTGTMMIHPVRMTGMVIGAAQTYEYFEMIQDRILSFVSSHCRVSYENLKALMHNNKMLTKDLGTVLVGTDAVEKGLINEVGGIREALKKLYSMMDSRG